MTLDKYFPLNDKTVMLMSTYKQAQRDIIYISLCLLKYPVGSFPHHPPQKKKKIHIFPSSFHFHLVEVALSCNVTEWQSIEFSA